MEKYIKFNNIKLGDTILLDGNPKRMVAYKRLKEQGINTIEQLFIKYDNDTIDYGKNTEVMDIFEAVETKGVVKLLRYKYLNQLLYINPLTNLSKMTNRKEFIYYLQSIGLPYRACLESYFLINKQYNKTITLIDLLKTIKNNNIYDGNYPKCFQTSLNEKIKLLLECSEKILMNINSEYFENIDDDVVNMWFEKMEPIEVQIYKDYKKTEIEIFKEVNWSKYNEAELLENDQEFYTYVKLKKKIEEIKGKM